MRWQILPILFIFTIVPLSVNAANPAEIAKQMEQIRREREALLVEQAKLQAELERVNREGQTLGTAVKSLDATRKKLAADIRLTQSKISSTDLSIRSLETTMADKEYQIATHERAIGIALQTISQQDMRPLWLDMITTSSFSDVWRDRTQLEGLSVDLNAVVRNLREVKSVLGEEKKKKEEAKKQIVSLQGELTGQKCCNKSSVSFIHLFSPKFQSYIKSIRDSAGKQGGQDMP